MTHVTKNIVVIYVQQVLSQHIKNVTGCYKVVRTVFSFNILYHIVFNFPVYIAVPITAFLTAVITALIISSIVYIVARKTAAKIEVTSQEESDIIYDLPLTHQKTIELQINTAYENINNQKM